ncbi:MAG: twin-arginine translocase subunit TatC [Candidatus Eremiobacteraeota bacterium]|nr:twin-arginine translocase subunit TatC [Candidatus Eremiobacteraeota bacterium]
MVTAPSRDLDAAEEQWDQKEMTFTEHLRELRKRLFIALGTILVLAIAAFYPSQFMIPWLSHQYFPGIKLNAFGPADVIMLELKLSVYAGIVVGLPVILYQLWMFIVPAFAPRTRRLVYLYIAPSVVLAALGLAFAHFLVLPRVGHALVAQTGKVATATFGISQTLNFVLLLLLLFVLIFQTPVVMVALARIGIVTPAHLRRYRRHALFGFFVFGGIVAPDGNPLTMALLAIPMYALFEISIWLIVLLERTWRSAPA